MKKYIPSMYKKDIFNINYKKLKNIGIKCLIFDLDNTIALIDSKIISKEVRNLFTELKKDFNIIIISNNTKNRISTYCNPIDIWFVSFALKPLTHGFRKVRKKLNYKKEEMCMIGDQIMTDILGGNRYGIFTILVDPLGEKDLKVTSINRFFERKILKRLGQMKVLERGKYYE